MRTRRSFESELSSGVVRWYRKQGRGFSWRKGGLSLFHSLLLEILLVRTRVAAVDEVFAGLCKSYPTPSSLLQSSESEVSDALASLGLSGKRSRALRKLRHILVEQHKA